MYIRKFKYQSPTERGFTQYKMSRKEHNRLFKNRKMPWYARAEYYVNQDKTHILIHKYTNIWGIIANTLLFPAVVVMAGLSNWKSIKRDYYELFNERETGSFTPEDIYRDKEFVDAMLQCLKEVK